MRLQHMMASLALALAAAGCTTQRVPQQAARTDSPPVAAAILAAPPAQGTALPFRAATAIAEQRREGRPTMLAGVRFSQEAQAGQGFDRIVFSFAGDSAAGYHVAYTDKPVRRCGSGQPVTVAGSAHLVVRLEPAQAHEGHGDLTPAPRTLAVQLPVVKDLKLVCDFEGQLEWVLGLAGKRPFRVTELSGPPRIAIDVAHPE